MKYIFNLFVFALVININCLNAQISCDLDQEQPNPDIGIGIGGQFFQAQGIIPNSSGQVETIDLWVINSTSPATLQVELQTVDEEGKPSGEVIGTADPIDLPPSVSTYEVSADFSCSLPYIKAGETYALVLKAPEEGENIMGWYYSNASVLPGFSYTGFNFGEVWSQPYAEDFAFRLYICTDDQLLDFEPDGVSTAFTYFGSSLENEQTTVEANPDMTGINSSDQVLSYIKPADASALSGAFADPFPAGGIDAVNGTMLCVDFYSGHIGNLTLLLDSSTTGGEDWLATLTNTMVDEWEQLCFDFSLPSLQGNNQAAQGHLYDQLVIYPDYGMAQDDNASNYYLDNFDLRTNDGICLTETTLQVDMNKYEGLFDQVYLSGTLNNWSGTSHPMSDDDEDGIWEITLQLEKGVYQYRFSIDDLADIESFSGEESCTALGDDQGYTVYNRQLVVVESSNESLVCWNSCDECIFDVECKLDQEQPALDAGDGIGDSVYQAQVFVPTISGKIENIDLWLSNSTLPSVLEVEIRTVDAEGRPSGEILSISNPIDLAPSVEFFEVTANFACSPAQVLAGESYAIVVKGPDIQERTAGWYYGNVSAFPSFSYTSTDAGVTWPTQYIEDYAYRLYVCTDEIILDFEADGKTTDFTYFGSSLEGEKTTVIDNPNSSGINTSAKVLNYVRAANSQNASGALSDPAPERGVDAVNGNMICVDFHTDHIGNLSLRLENPSEGGEDWIATIPNEKINEWEQICFPFSMPSLEGSNLPAKGYHYERFSILPDYGMEQGDEPSNFYLDNFILTSADKECSERLNFAVDMNSYEQEFNSVYVKGSFNNWSEDANPLTDIDGDGVWETEINIVRGEHQYLFTLNESQIEEEFTGSESCTDIVNILGIDFAYRTIDVMEATTLDTVCWNSCVACITGTKDESISHLFDLYPTVTDDIIIIHFHEQNIEGEIHLISINGTVLTKQLIKTSIDKQIFQVDNLSPGLYFINVVTEKGSGAKMFTKI